MIIDITGIELTPGNFGKDCCGNGNHEFIECCCDECNYLICCMHKNYRQMCTNCTDGNCPRKRHEKACLKQ